MKTLGRLLALGLVALVGACANLEEVRDFAKQSAQLSAYGDLTQRYRDTYVREAPYLTAVERARAQVQALYPDLVKVQNQVSAYMATMAKLAGDDTFSLAKPEGALTDAISKAAFLKFDSAKVKAYGTIASIITKWITAAYQQRAIAEMVREGDPLFQLLIAGMQDLVRVYKGRHQSEKAKVIGFYEVNVRFTDDTRDRLLQTVAAAHFAEKRAEFEQIDEKFKQLESGLRGVATGHTALARNVEHLSTKEAKAAIKQIAKDIGTAVKALKELQGK